MPWLIQKQAVKKFSLALKNARKYILVKLNPKKNVKIQKLVNERLIAFFFNTATKEAFTKDEYTGGTEICEWEDEKYLGDIISKNAKMLVF